MAIFVEKEKKLFPEYTSGEVNAIMIYRLKKVCGRCDIDIAKMHKEIKKLVDSYMDNSINYAIHREQEGFCKMVKDDILFHLQSSVHHLKGQMVIYDNVLTFAMHFVDLVVNSSKYDECRGKIKYKDFILADVVKEDGKITDLIFRDNLYDISCEIRDESKKCHGIYMESSSENLFRFDEFRNIALFIEEKLKSTLIKKYTGVTKEQQNEDDLPVFELL